jgi:hypothetical protein
MSPWTILGWQLVVFFTLPVIALVVGLVDGAQEITRERR